MRYAWMLVVAALLASPLSRAAQETMYRCVHADGSIELRGRPCPPDTRGGPLEPGDGGSFSTIPATRPPEALLERAERFRREAKRRSVRAGGTEDEAGRLECAEYEKRVAAIDERLRKGYTASQGNRLRAERRRIRHLLADACR